MYCSSLGEARLKLPGGGEHGFGDVGNGKLALPSRSRRLYPAPSSTRLAWTRPCKTDRSKVLYDDV